MLLVALVGSLVVSYFSFPLVIQAFRRASITGNDRHKPGNPDISEMGGLVTLAGFSIGISWRQR